MSDCTRCTAPAPDAFLCPTCTIALRIELTDVPDLLTNLDITRSRQDHLTAPYDHGPAAGDIPLPYKPHIAEVVWALHDTLGFWVARALNRSVHEHTPTADLARHLLSHMDLIRTSPQAAQLVEEITTAVHQARRAIDRPNDQRLFLGPCSTGDCREEVYGLPWNRIAACQRCGAEHDIQARQDWLRDAAQDHLGTAVEIAGFLRATGMRCTPEMIRGYAARKRLTAPSTNNQGHPLYRIRDVLTALEMRYQHRTAS